MTHTPLNIQQRYIIERVTQSPGLTETQLLNELNCPASDIPSVRRELAQADLDNLVRSGHIKIHKETYYHPSGLLLAAQQNPSSFIHDPSHKALSIIQQDILELVTSHPGIIESELLATLHCTLEDVTSLINTAYLTFFREYHYYPPETAPATPARTLTVFPNDDRLPVTEPTLKPAEYHPEEITQAVLHAIESQAIERPTPAFTLDRVVYNFNRDDNILGYVEFKNNKDGNGGIFVTGEPIFTTETEVDQFAVILKNLLRHAA